MDILLFIKGIAVGFAIAAPVGPVGILCMQRSLTKGFLYGLFSGTGAAMADAIFGAVAAFGVSFVSEFLTREQFWFQVGGASLLLVMGIHTIFAEWRPPGERAGANDLAHDLVTTFFLTITNPITIFSLTAVFVAVGITSGTETLLGGGLVTGGVFVGSALWWCILCSAFSLGRSVMSGIYLKRIHRAAGFVMLTFGTGVFIHLLLPRVFS
ncbi:MAG TPA: LysE family transporter [Alphaproteobacteria bacterium]|nr:LysE family transporter [Alphaproteobacteria bacterium]